MAYDIFVSYRRFDNTGRISGTDIARCIKLQLELCGYQGRVFFDHTNINDDEYEQVIMSAIEQCRVFVLVLTKDSMMRCGNKNDMVRREILHARLHGLKIVPVVVDDLFNNEYPEDFPVELNIIKRLQHTTIHRDASFERDVAHLVERRISSVVKPEAIAAKAAKSALVRLNTNVECRVYRFDEELTVAPKGFSEIRLPKGKHLLSFVNVDDESDRVEQLVDIKEYDYEEFVAVKLRERAKSMVDKQSAYAGSNNGRRYNVGDYYDVDGRRGVVFQVSDDGYHGRIVSLDQTSLPWCTDQQYECLVAVHTTSLRDGNYNSSKVMSEYGGYKYPAFAWCNNLGQGWYLPAKDECRMLLLNDDVHAAVNATLKAIGAVKLSEFKSNNIFYWSSTECMLFSEREAIGINMRSGNPKNYSKCSRGYIRAVSRF